MHFQFRSILMLLSIAWLLAACVVQPIQPVVSATPTPGAAPETPDATAVAVRNLLGRQLHIDPATITLVNAEPVEWPDACLGVRLPNQVCASVVVPGYKLTFNVAGQEYVLHSDQGGYQVRVVAAPEPAVGEPLLYWGGTADNGLCMEATLAGTGIAFGICGGSAPIGGKYAADARQTVLNEWVARFAPFDAETEWGSIRLLGTGNTQATPAEQEQIGRWAQTAVMEAAGGESLAGLRYEGPAEFGSADTSKCAVLQLGTPIEAGIGACDGTMTNKDMGKATYLQWEYLRDQFAAFVYETATEKITFEGMGNVSGEPWQRAILAWARTRHAELAGNGISATMSTALSWNLGQDMSQKNICQHLTVLSYGYAYAEERLCEGNDLVNSTGAWLTTAELSQFDTWLYDRAPLAVDNNYIDGQGTQAMSEAEVVEANLWAMDLWTRVRATGNDVPSESAVATCPEARTGLAMVRAYDRGFCLLVPATHTVFEPNPDELVIAKGTLLNSIEPRAHIVVTPADGRTAEQVADALVAEMAGFEIKRSNAEVAGQPAVILDNLPGQDINRRVVLVYNDRLYALTFFPMDHAEIEPFYQAIMADFTLVEPE